MTQLSVSPLPYITIYIAYVGSLSQILSYSSQVSYYMQAILDETICLGEVLNMKTNVRLLGQPLCQSRKNP